MSFHQIIIYCLLSSCKCGLAVRNNKIVGGEETEVNEYPWQIGIVNKGKTRPNVE